MVIESSNTRLDMLLKRTGSNIGLRGNDEWLKVNFKLYNDSVDYEICRESFTYNEFLNAIARAREFFKGNIPSSRISFIKNFFFINLYNKDNEKVLELTLVMMIGSNDKYTVKFKNDEITAFLDYAESCIE